jgi:hypothetical protein
LHQAGGWDIIAGLDYLFQYLIRGKEECCEENRCFGGDRSVGGSH